MFYRKLYKNLILSRFCPDLRKKQRFYACKSLFFSVLSGKRGSNPRPAAWEAAALPTELLPRFGLRLMVYGLRILSVYKVFLKP